MRKNALQVLGCANANVSSCSLESVLMRHVQWTQSLTWLTAALLMSYITRRRISYIFVSVPWQLSSTFSRQLTALKNLMLRKMYRFFVLLAVHQTTHKVWHILDFSWTKMTNRTEYFPTVWWFIAHSLHCLCLKMHVKILNYVFLYDFALLLCPHLHVCS